MRLRQLGFIRFLVVEIVSVFQLVFFFFRPKALLSLIEVGFWHEVCWNGDVSVLSEVWKLRILEVHLGAVRFSCGLLVERYTCTLNNDHSVSIRYPCHRLRICNRRLPPFIVQQSFLLLQLIFIPLHASLVISVFLSQTEEMIDNYVLRFLQPFSVLGFGNYLVYQEWSCQLLIADVHSLTFADEGKSVSKVFVFNSLLEIGLCHVFVILRQL